MTRMEKVFLGMLATVLAGTVAYWWIFLRSLKLDPMKVLPAGSHAVLIAQWTEGFPRELFCKIVEETAGVNRWLSEKTSGLYRVTSFVPGKPAEYVSVLRGDFPDETLQGMGNQVYEGIDVIELSDRGPGRSPQWLLYLKRHRTVVSGTKDAVQDLLGILREGGKSLSNDPMLKDVLACRGNSPLWACGIITQAYRDDFARNPKLNTLVQAQDFLAEGDCDGKAFSVALRVRCQDAGSAKAVEKQIQGPAPLILLLQVPSLNFLYPKAFKLDQISAVSEGEEARFSYKGPMEKLQMERWGAPN